MSCSAACPICKTTPRRIGRDGSHAPQPMPWKTEIASITGESRQLAKGRPQSAAELETIVAGLEDSFARLRQTRSDRDARRHKASEFTDDSDGRHNQPGL